MKNKIKFTICLLLLSVIYSHGCSLWAQQKAPNFKVKSKAIKYNGAKTNIATSFVKRNKLLIWTQKVNDKKVVRSFKIKDVFGNWDKVQAIGELTLDLSLDGQQATFRLISNESRKRAVLSFNHRDTQVKYNFNIHSFKYHK